MSLNSNLKCCDIAGGEEMLLYPIHLENLSFAVEKTIGFNLDGVYNQSQLNSGQTLLVSQLRSLLHSL
jgi:hypothetical protein